MGAYDLRLSFEFLTHRKTRLLKARYGPEGIVNLISLWTFCGKNYKQGVLHNLSDEEWMVIFDRPDWEAFRNYLVTIRWLDYDNNGTYKVHDWQEHQLWIYRSDNISKRCSEMGRQGAEKRWKETKTNQAVNGVPHNVPNRDPYSPITNNQYPITKEKKKTLRTKQPQMTLPEWIDPVIWDAYIEMRRSIKQPPTLHAMHLVIDQLEKFKALGDDPNAVLEQSIRSNWRDVYRLKTPKDRFESNVDACKQWLKSREEENS